MDEQAVAWLREQVQARLAAARGALESADAHWYELSSGVLVTGSGSDEDHWDGTWPMGDSRLTRFIAANDPRQIIADCEADLAILDAHDKPRHYCPLPVLGSEHGQLWTPEEGPCWTVHLVARKYRHQDGYAKHWSDG